MATCNRPGCPDAIFWGKTVASGRLMPCDSRPVEDGNVLIVGHEDHKPLLRVLKKGEDPPPEVLRYMAHWATCKNPPPRKAKK